jgi:hypothetical protein
MTDVVVLLIITAGLAVVGIRVGMLLAPRIERWGDAPEEEAHAPDDDDR